MFSLGYLLIIGISSVFTGMLLLFYSKYKMDKAGDLLKLSYEKWENTKKDIENEKREAMLKIKDEIYKKRNDFEIEVKRDRLELEKFQNKLNSRYETLEKKEQRIDELKRDLQQTERQLSRASDQIRTNEEKIKKLYNELVDKLENISELSKDDAKKLLLSTLESEVKISNQRWLQKIEDEARTEGKEKAISIVVDAMQRYTSDQVALHSSVVVHLPNDDMKGRIIGKEGRNIKALEMSTGVEFVIGDTPEIITISAFNPIRREIAKRALERLIIDGRINPTRIEETVEKCELEVNELILEKGKEAVLSFNLQGIKSEMIELLGKLHFRTSFSQNVLLHSKEVAVFSRIIAEELGLNGQVALRAGLLHDIGKALPEEVEGSHSALGAEIAKRCGESPEVVNAIAAHHEEIPFTSLYAPIIMIADTISASRPGARRETLAAYLKRLEELEDIATSFDGVKKAYALQAGREIRIIVEEEKLNDETACVLARDIAKKIESEMNYPGQIKVNVIREKRSIEYAR